LQRRFGRGRMKNRTEIENIKSFIEENKNNTTTIIVEGLKDTNVLNKLGFKNIFSISGKPLIRVVEEIIESKPEDIVILTDYDKEGKVKAKELEKLFKSQGLHVNLDFRQKFKKFFKIYKIEEARYILKFL
jgi:5S rRNA maturation endonuclease (ribonuclease M5)